MADPGTSELTDGDRQLLDSHRAAVDDLLERAIGSPRHVAVLHFPYDGNVGNHMMWAAVMDWLDERKITVAYAAHATNFDVATLRASIGDDPILFSGGVTMSRLWREHPDTKRTVAREFRSNRLVSLTSTMLFVDDDDEREASEIFGGHDDVALLARDPVSGANATRIFGDAVDVLVGHDMAFRLPPMSPSGDRAGILWLRRDDAEAAEIAVPPGVEQFDWPMIWDPMFRPAYLRMRAVAAVSRVRDRTGRHTPSIVNRLMARHYAQSSRLMVQAGATELGRARVLVTDRMHPHILSVLIGQDVVILPDRYGKNRAVFDYSTERFSTVHWADDEHEALELAHALAGA